MSLLCRVADVSRKSYYYHLRHPSSTADAEITDVIRRLQSDHKGSIGYRPMTRLVSQECGKNVNRKRVRRLMKENAHGMLTTINDYLMQGNALTDGMQRIIDGLKAKGFDIEQNESGFYGLAKRR